MNTPHDSLLAPGQQLTRRYRIGELLGATPRGAVYSALDRHSGARVALRIIETRSVRDQPGFAAMFVEECKRRMALSHPHAFDVLGFGQTRTRRFFVASELWRGVPMSRALTARGPLDAHLASEITARVCAALAQAHSVGLVHGRVSPQKVYLTGRGVGGIRLGGMGEAVLADTVASQPLVRGEACFSAPERIAGAPLTARTDVYGVGLLLFALLTGRAPHEHESGLNILLSQQREGAFPHAFRSTLWHSAPFLVPVLERCLAVDPRQRFANIACVRDALQRQSIYVAA